MKKEIKQRAIEKIIRNNYSGTIAASTGIGKSAIAIEAIKIGKFKKVLIVSPRTNLKENWRNELTKWNFPIENTEIENIQTAYKWENDKINNFDIIIADECHTIFTPEYSKLIIRAREMNIPVIGLTATPDIENDYRKEFYKKYCPIIFEYYNGEEDNIINKIKYVTIIYELDNNTQIIVGNKKRKWITTELYQYQYLQKQYDMAKNMMYNVGASGDYFNQALKWMKDKEVSKSQREAGLKFVYAVKNRKDFLWNLESSANIAKKIKENVLAENSTNKVLIFSELTSQANKVSPYSIHSNNEKEYNNILLEKFNKGEIRELSSCLSLTLGLNLNNATHAIFESYSSSSVQAIQRSGRLHRLNTNINAIAYIIIPKNTQAESWAIESFGKLLEL